MLRKNLVIMVFMLLPLILLSQVIWQEEFAYGEEYWDIFNPWVVDGNWNLS